MGYDTFVIPEGVIKLADEVLLSIAPIRVAWVVRGVFANGTTFDTIEEADNTTTTVMRAAGSLICVVGCYLALSPAAGVAMVVS